MQSEIIAMLEIMNYMDNNIEILNKCTLSTNKHRGKQIRSVSICLLSYDFFITVFICRDIALIQYFYTIIYVIHNFQHCNYLTLHIIYYVH